MSRKASAYRAQDMAKGFDVILKTPLVYLLSSPEPSPAAVSSPTDLSPTVRRHRSSETGLELRDDHPGSSESGRLLATAAQASLSVVESRRSVGLASPRRNLRCASADSRAVVTQLAIKRNAESTTASMCVYVALVSIEAAEFVLSVARGVVVAVEEVSRFPKLWLHDRCMAAGQHPVELSEGKRTGVELVLCE